jgi:glucose/arabinose dehydrogenase
VTKRGIILCSALLLVACSDDTGFRPDGGDAAAGDTSQQGGDGGGGDSSVPVRCNGSVTSNSSPATGVPTTPALTVPAGFSLKVIAAVSDARQLAALPNGDLLVGTSGPSVYLVPNAARASGAEAPVVFTTVNDAPVQGVAFAASTCTVYVASKHGIFAIPYRDGQQSGSPGSAIARVRPQVSGGHDTTSVAYGAGVLYAGVGSSCNACVETDPTRATIVDKTNNRAFVVEGDVRPRVGKGEMTEKRLSRTQQQGAWL